MTWGGVVRSEEIVSTDNAMTANQISPHLIRGQFKRVERTEIGSYQVLTFDKMVRLRIRPDGE